jgi:Sec-independent protein translocase protein TatA
MPGFGHFWELLLVCMLGLLFLGPKRMIEMGSALGRALRELREATKDLNLSSLLESSEPSKPTSATLGALSQFTQSLSSSIKDMSHPATATTSKPAPSLDSAAIVSEQKTPETPPLETDSYSN